MPKTIDCEIRDDQIDSCISGDVVTVCGIMKTEIQNEQKSFNHWGGPNNNKGLYASYIEVNSIKNTNNEVFGNNE